MKMTGMATDEVVTTEPHPTTITVCDQCGEDWAEHRKLAERDAKRDHYSSRKIGVRTAADWGLLQQAMNEAKPTLSHCVALLKIANQGPVGPAGPSGQDGYSPQAYR